MKTKMLLLFSCAALALLALFALRAKRSAIEAQAATSSLAAQNGQLRAEINEQEKRLRETRVFVAAVKPPKASPRGDSNRSADAPARAPRMSGITLIANDPVKRKAYMANFRAQLDLDYGGVFTALRLPPEQIEKFKDAEVGLEQERIDLQAAIETQRLDPNSEEARKLRADYGKSRQRKKAEVLGDLADRYQEYYHTASVRQEAQRLATPYLVPGETVTANQVERTADVLIANSQRKAGGGRGVEPGTVNWNVAREQLKGILSPAQIGWLELFVEEEAASARVGRLQAQLTAQFRSKASSNQK
jgi:hypothetical protein